MPSNSYYMARAHELDAEIKRLLPLTTDAAGERVHGGALMKLYALEKSHMAAWTAETAGQGVTPTADPPTRPAKADPAKAAARQAAAERVPLPASAEAAIYSRQFAHYLRTGSPFAFAGLSTGNLQGGGYLAPAEYRRGLTHGPDTTFFRALANVRPPTDRPSVSQAGRRSLATVAWSETLPEPSGLKIGLLTLTPQYLSGRLIVSKDLANTPGNEAILMNEILAAAGREEERAFVAGDGITQPLGVFTAAEQGIPTGRDVTGPAGLDVFVTALTSIPARHLRSASLRWVMHPRAYALLLALKASTGEPLVETGDGPDARPTVLGVPVELTDDAPAGSGAGGSFQSGDYLAAVGDLAAYDIQDGPDFGVERFNDATFNAQNQVLFSFRRKVDGLPRLPEAFARVKLA